MKLNLNVKKYGPIAGWVANYKKTNPGKRFPWTSAWSNIYGRCNYPSMNKYEYYGGLGIKCLVSTSDLRATFIRDNGMALKRPSVDRIRPEDHYTPDNIQWIELAENAIKRRRGILKKVWTRQYRYPIGPRQWKICPSDKCKKGFVSKFYTRIKPEFCSRICRDRVRTKEYYHRVLKHKRTPKNNRHLSKEKPWPGAKLCYTILRWLTPPRRKREVV